MNMPINTGWVSGATPEELMGWDKIMRVTVRSAIHAHVWR